MNTHFKTLLKDKIILISFWGSCLFLVLTIIITALSYSHLPPYLPIYNKLAWGYARLGHTYEIAIPILIPIFLSICNFFIGKYLYEKSPLLSRFIFLITLLITIFTCIFIVKMTLIIL